MDDASARGPQRSNRGLRGPGVSELAAVRAVARAALVEVERSLNGRLRNGPLSGHRFGRAVAVLLENSTQRLRPQRVAGAEDLLLLLPVDHDGAGQSRGTKQLVHLLAVLGPDVDDGNDVIVEDAARGFVLLQGIE